MTKNISHNKTLIIAEAGVNHNGDMDLAKKLIDVAHEAKADFVKFQSFKASNLVIPTAKKANYQIENTKTADETQHQMLKKLELSDADHEILIDYCNEKGIQFLSTPFSTFGVDYLEDKVELYKIPSGEVTNYPLLKAAANKKKPIILSTGMCTLDEVKSAVEIIKKEWEKFDISPNQKYRSENFQIDFLTLLHCSTSYPTPFSSVNLKAMCSMEKETNISTGYSDHTLGIEVPVAAVSLGAKVIEKHFTLDRNLPGPDHLASLEPEELIKMVRSIRNIEESLGDGVKTPSPAEKENIPIARKSLFYSSDFNSGHIISEDDLMILRPGDGLSPINFDTIVGKKIETNVAKYDYVKLEHLN